MHNHDSTSVPVVLVESNFVTEILDQPPDVLAMLLQDKRSA